MFLILWHFDGPGSLFEIGVLNMTGDPTKKQEAGRPLISWFFHVSMGVTALSILTSIACGVYANRGFATLTPNPPNSLIQVNIPFNTLHFAIALGSVVKISIRTRTGGLIVSATLLIFLLCNRNARKHVALRLRQLIDRLTIGGNNSFDPFVSLALVVRALIVRFTVGGHNAVAPGNVSIAVVGGDQVAQVAPPPQLSTRRWAVPSDRYAVTLPEFLDVIDVEETSM